MRKYRYWVAAFVAIAILANVLSNSRVNYLAHSQQPLMLVQEAERVATHKTLAASHILWTSGESVGQRSVNWNAINTDAVNWNNVS